jgi:hypothetical protein
MESDTVCQKWSRREIIIIILHHILICESNSWVYKQETGFVAGNWKRGMVT